MPRPTPPEPDAASKCANCGAPLSGEWCYGCGQRDIDLERPFLSLLWHTVAETFDIDGRFIQSLKLLLRRPGVLGRMWIDGRRTARSSPVRMFLFIGFMFALVLNFQLRSLEADWALRYPDKVAVYDGEQLTIDLSDESGSAVATFERVGTLLDASFEEMNGQPAPDVLAVILYGAIDALIQVTVLAVIGLSLFWKVLVWRRPLIMHLVVTLDFVTFGYLLYMLMMLAHTLLSLFLADAMPPVMLAAAGLFAHHLYGIGLASYDLGGWARLWRTTLVWVAVLFALPATFILAMIITIGSL